MSKLTDFILRSDSSPETKQKPSKAWKDFVIALISTALCVALLAGATFAWYTSTTESPAQVIQTGNLEMRLEYLTGVSGTETTWANAAADDAKIFNDNNDLESNKKLNPNEIVSAVLKITNEGDIAAYYSLEMYLQSSTPGTSGSDSVDLSSIVNVAWCDLGSDEAWVAADAEHDEKALIAAAVKGDGAKLIKCYSADQAINPDGYSGDIMSGTLDADATNYYIVGLYVPENANLTYDITSAAPQLNVTFRLRSSQIIEEEKTVTSPEPTTIPAVYAPLPWDGVSKTEVEFEAPEDGEYAGKKVYSVGTAEELAYVIDLLCSNSLGWTGDAVIKLTNNIELNNKPITLNALNANVSSLTVNGNGYKIYNLNMRTSDTNITVQTPMLFASDNKITYSDGLFSGVTVTTP